MGLGRHESKNEAREQNAKSDIDRMAVGKQDGVAGHPPIELQESDHRTGESDRSNCGAERHFEQRRAMNFVGNAETETLRSIKRARGDEYRRKADESVEEGDELRHRRH